MKNSFQLNNKTILITGASSGIGRATAIKCAGMGGRLVITGRNSVKLQETFNNLTGENHCIIEGDLTEEKSLNNIIQDCPELDGVVHCAGVVHPFPIGYINSEKINQTFKPNFYAAVELTNKLFKSKKINHHASLVFLSSISGQHPHKGGAMYAASKAAIEAFSKTIALEFASKAIRSNCLCPAMVKTAMFDTAAEGITEEAMEMHIKKYPLGVGYPEDIANAAVFLLSPASRWITGTNIVLDGGLLLAY